jgi:flagellar motor switch protein FliG
VSLQAEDRVLVVLDALGRETAELVLSRLAPARGDALRKRLAQFKSPAGAADEVDLVLGEFQRTLQFALSKAENSLDSDDGEPRAASPNAAASPRPKAKPALSAFQPSDDPIDDLNRLEAFQIGRALRDESPRAIALVLGCLASDKAGATLEQLPSETRNAVFVQLSKRPTTSAELLHGLVRATVAKGSMLDRAAEQDEASDSDARTADLLRAMDKAHRTEMLEALNRSDPEAAARVRKLLFRFEDLGRVTNRSLQTLLGEIDTRTLAAALKGADAALASKVMDNLSSRARASLKEEIDLLSSLTSAKQREARNSVAEALGRMDLTGDLVMEE